MLFYPYIAVISDLLLWLFYFIFEFKLVDTMGHRHIVTHVDLTPQGEVEYHFIREWKYETPLLLKNTVSTSR